MEKFTMAGATAVHYTDSGGDGRAVILLHGYLESLEIWDDFADALAREGFRTVTLDLPGHGVSEVVGEVHTMEFLADTVMALADKIGVREPVIVGHSMGGYAALACVEKYPEEVGGLVLFSSTPNADSDEKKENRLRETEIVASGRKELLARTTPAKGFAPENRERLRELIDDMSLQVMLTEDEGIIALLRGMAERGDMNEMLRNSKVPQLFIFGRRDEYISPEAAETIVKNNPQARVAWLENSGHNGFLEDPEASLAIITEFVNSLPEDDNKG